MRRVRVLMVTMVAVAVSAAAFAAPAASSLGNPALSTPRVQGAPVTSANIGTLETSADQIGQAIGSLRKSDPTLANEVEERLADLRDEITYLKVKLRKDGSVPRSDFTDLRDKMETLRVRAGISASDKVSAAPVIGGEMGRMWTVPVGTTMDVRLQTPLNSGTATVEQRFEATTLTDLVMGRDNVIPAGSVLRGFVSSVSAAGKVNRKGNIALSFDEIVVGRTPARLRASVTKALDGKMSDDAGKIGAGAVIGGVIGGLLGGGKGALAGILIGGGGMAAASDGADVDLPLGTILTVRLDQPLDVSRMEPVIR